MNTLRASIEELKPDDERLILEKLAQEKLVLEKLAKQYAEQLAKFAAIIGMSLITNEVSKLINIKGEE